MTVVAYSFKRRFVEPIRKGRKAHTMRNDRARHARLGEQLQLYCGMRTRGCFLIARAACLNVQPVRLDFDTRKVKIGERTNLGTRKELDAFARSDGFADWEELAAFWFAEHDAPRAWSGVIIFWHALEVPT